LSLVRPEILPEEFETGFKGRLMRINGITKEERFDDTLRQWAGHRGHVKSVTSMADLLAAAAGLSTAAYVQQHTLLPLRSALVRSGSEHAHGTRVSEKPLDPWSLRPCRGAAAFCPHCVAEDLEFHGVAYWRREHQIAGMYWCTKHLQSLRLFGDRRAFLRSPSEFVESDAHHDTAWTGPLQGSPIIERYLAIASDLLNRRHPLDGFAVSRGLRDLARERGFHYGQGDIRGDLLSDFLIEAFDRQWLSAVIPNIKRKRYKELFPAIDLATAGSYFRISSHVHIAAYAALFDTAEEAISALTRAGTTPPKPRAAVPAVLTDAESARRMYVEFRGNHLRMAKALGVGRPLVARELIKFGLPGLGRQPAEALRVVLARFIRDGHSVDWACNGHPESVKDFETFLRSTATHLLTALDDMALNDEQREDRRTTTPANLPCGQDGPTKDNLRPRAAAFRRRRRRRPSQTTVKDAVADAPP
jgi:hypothetical protein